ncbi:arrestin domain containing protein [Ophiocordyceps sinensis CO18]|uniref:Arrestin domain containing protein n=1 Tax=Ophiocordyceps sinensis (strain Co18 / CGMCC 3.14243) TaxID=911162 RepID=T5A9A7_OPHSC|nr:arrestin domain containing protein [Ophiocordyceps sinensis CO18]
MPVPPRQNRSRNGNWIISNGGNVFYRADSLARDGSAAQQSSPTLPAPLIGPRRTRPHAIHIVTYPPGYVPRELRPKPASKSRKAVDSLRSGSKKPGHAQDQSSADVGENEGTGAVHDDEVRHGRRRGRRVAAHGNRNSNRNSLMSVRSAKSAVGSLVAEVPKPVASGSGVTCSILMAEPNVFLSGFDHDHETHRESSSGGTALLRGKLHLCVSKNIKIKAVQLKLIGRARTEWPEGIPPLKQDVVEEESLRTQVLTFFNAINDGWETEYGNQCTYKLRAASASSSSTTLSTLPRVNSLKPMPASNRAGLTPKELKRLSLQSVQSRSFGKSDSAVAVSTQAKGFKVFYPGTYDYSFELPIDHHQLETTKLHYGSVRWELHATVDRAGAFKPNLHGMKEVSIVRLPDQMSLETTEPISISRQWEDQLHYDIVISGKSFPIGSKIPIAFKLTPLAKVQVHKLKVYVTETIEYWTNDKRVTRKDPGRKILLLEKSAGKPLDSHWASSDMTTIRGGEPSVAERRDARQVAQLRRVIEASRTHGSPELLPEPSANLLGDLDLGLESMWGSTEIEANVQIPTCETMAKNKDLRLHADCSWKNVNVFHWIKVCVHPLGLPWANPLGLPWANPLGLPWANPLGLPWANPLGLPWANPLGLPWANPLGLPWANPLGLPWANPLGLPWANPLGLPWANPLGLPWANPLGLPWANPLGLPWANPLGLPWANPLGLPWANPLGLPWANPLGLPWANPLGLPWANPLGLPWANPLGLPWANPLGLPWANPLGLPWANPLGLPWANPLGLPWANPLGLPGPGAHEDARPIHLLRAPSFDPPAFYADTAPPPAIVVENTDAVMMPAILTPPPQYDSVVGTPSVDGLADYFSRLADHGFPDDQDSNSESEELPSGILHRTGRVSVSHPRAPGARMPSRSMELPAHR